MTALLRRHQPLSTVDGILRDKNKGNQLTKVKAEGKITFKEKLDKAGPFSICTTACLSGVPCQNMEASTQEGHMGRRQPEIASAATDQQAAGNQKNRKLKTSTCLKLIIWKNAGIHPEVSRQKRHLQLPKGKSLRHKIQDVSLTDPQPKITAGDILPKFFFSLIFIATQPHLTSR